MDIVRRNTGSIWERNLHTWKASLNGTPHPTLKCLQGYFNRTGTTGLPGTKDPSCQRCCQLERRLSSKLHYNAIWSLLLDNIQHIFNSQRLKIETRWCIIVSRYCFRIGIHHNCFVTSVSEWEGSMAATVIEFNTLTNSIGSSTENQHLFVAGRITLALTIIWRIHIWSICLELCGTCINTLHARNNTQGSACCTDSSLIDPLDMNRYDWYRFDAWK